MPKDIGFLLEKNHIGHSTLAWKNQYLSYPKQIKPHYAIITHIHTLEYTQLYLLILTHKADDGGNWNRYECVQGKLMNLHCRRCKSFSWKNRVACITIQLRKHVWKSTKTKYLLNKSSIYEEKSLRCLWPTIIYKMNERIACYYFHEVRRNIVNTHFLFIEDAAWHVTGFSNTLNNWRGTMI